MRGRCPSSVVRFGLEVAGPLCIFTPGALSEPLLCQGNVGLGLGEKDEVPVFNSQILCACPQAGYLTL